MQRSKLAHWAHTQYNRKSPEWELTRSRVHDHGFEVVRTDGDGTAIPIAVVTVGEGDQLAVQGVALLRGQGLKCAQRRAIIGAKEVDVLLGRAEAENGRAVIAGDGLGQIAEEHVLVIFIAPTDGRLQAGERGEIPREEAKRL